MGPIGGPMKLTAKFVENVTEAGKYYDSNGLFLHIRPSGAKKWLQDCQEQAAILQSGRSNNYLETTKLQTLYPSVLPIHKSVENALYRMKNDFTEK